MTTRMARDTVPVEMTWDLKALFASMEAWEQELVQVSQDLSTVTKFKGRLHEGPEFLLGCLSAQEALQARVTRVATYANLNSSADGANPVHQANSGKVGAMLAFVTSGLSFIKSEILELPDGTMVRYFEQEPSLREFRKHLEDLLLTKPFQLSPETENALAALDEVFSAPYSIYQRSKSADMEFSSVVDEDGREQPVSFALYEDHYEFLPNTALRRNAYHSFVQTLRQYQNTFAAVYNTEVKKQVALARLRNYENTTEMLLQPQQVPIELYENILNVIQTELAPHMRRFAKLKQRVLGLDQMLHCDLKVPLDVEFSPKMTFGEGAELILKALSVMGEEYTAIIQKALTERWVDYADNVGKGTGAFCSSPYGAHPYILITWTDTMRSAFVLAHELGHAGHFTLAQKHQRLFNTRPSMSFVEAPSTMNEQLLGNYILSQTNDPNVRRFVITQFLGTYYHNFVTHLLEGEFQRRIYRLAEGGHTITAKVLSAQKSEVLSTFWGDAVEIDEGAGLTWMRQPHYYMGLYPYTYSVGLTVSTAMAAMIRQEGPPAIHRWLDVLKAGGTLAPLELMKMAGVDLSTPDPIRSAVQYVGCLINELEASYV